MEVKDNSTRRVHGDFLVSFYMTKGDKKSIDNAGLHFVDLGENVIVAGKWIKIM